MLMAEDRTDWLRDRAFDLSPLGRPNDELGETAQWLWEELAFVWLDFEEQLARIPVIASIEDGTVAIEEYRDLLRDLRQQVIDGGRWIALAASSIGATLFPVRSMLLTHAAEEHRDFLLLETNYVAAGGEVAEILNSPKNIGSEALSAYMFREATLPDPLHLFGAMFIVEGLGTAKAAGWAKQVQDALGLGPEAVSFLAYHGQNDDSHYAKLVGVLSHPLVDRPLAERLVRTARVVARLYALQLEEVGNR
jgi:3-oxoacyl-[acyl-carrier-protein] synthase-3